MDNYMKLLIAGTGPVAIQFVVNTKNHTKNCKIGLCGRNSKKAKVLYRDLEENLYILESCVQNEAHNVMRGKSKIDALFKDYSEIYDEWDILVLTVTNDSYSDVLNKIPLAVLKFLKTIILISSCVGSTLVVKGILKSRNLANINIITLSTYYADTKRDKSFGISTKVITKNIKKKIYLYSENKISNKKEDLIKMLNQLGIKVLELDNMFDVESKSISTYVHPSILINKYALENIFNPKSPQKYIYKFFPEGPITQYVIRNMLNQLSEMRLLYKKLGVKTFNFLKFINDDNYPVQEACLSREDIEGFEEFSRIKQEYLVYIRYASILVDATSIPDEKGRYFDFSAVSMEKVYKNDENLWEIPRSPKEDYYRIGLLKSLASQYRIDTPTIDSLIEIYEKEVMAFRNSHKKDALTRDFYDLGIKDGIYIKKALE